MTKSSLKAFVYLLFFTSIGITSAVAQCKEIVGYYPNWKQYQRNNIFHQKNVDFSKFSIINYAFMSPDAEGNIVLADPWGDALILEPEIDWEKTKDPNFPVRVPFTSMVDLAHKEGTKVNVSLGGWTLSEYFTHVAADPKKRAKFASECVRVIKRYGFDGIDIDWEFPGDLTHAGRAEDFETLPLMMKQIRDSLDAYGKKTNRYYMLTIVVHAIPNLAKNIDWPKVAPLCDYVMYFGYDFNGAWSPENNHQSALYPTKEGDKALNIASAFELLRDKYKVPGNKIIIGTGFYGRSNKTNGTAELYGKNSGNPDAETFPHDEGSPTYHRIVDAIDQFEVKWDDDCKVPYLLGKKINSFVSFDNVESIEAKAEYIVEKGAAGCLIWEISHDMIETKPNSGIVAGTPLLDKLNEVLRSGCRQVSIKVDDLKMDEFDVR